MFTEPSLFKVEEHKNDLRRLSTKLIKLLVDICPVIIPPLFGPGTRCVQAARIAINVIPSDGATCLEQGKTFVVAINISLSHTSYAVGIFINVTCWECFYLLVEKATVASIAEYSKWTMLCWEFGVYTDLVWLKYIIIVNVLTKLYQHNMSK